MTPVISSEFSPDFSPEFSKEELRHLRYRLGWSQAEMARNLNVEFTTLSGLEAGRSVIPAEMRSSLIRISQQADSNADHTQRRVIAEMLMTEKGLSQIHNFDCEIDSSEEIAARLKGRA